MKLFLRLNETDPGGSGENRSKQMPALKKHFTRVKVILLTPSFRKNLFYYQSSIEGKVFTYTEYSPFVILCSERTGSNLLISYLNSHPRIRAYGELFNFEYIFPNPAMVYNPQYYLEKCIFRPYPPHIQAVGYKMFYHQARYTESRAGNFSLVSRKLTRHQKEGVSSVWDYLSHRKDIHIIHLERHNLLRAYISKKIASKTDKWALYKHEARPYKISLSPEEFFKSIEKHTEIKNDSLTAFAPHSLYTVSYRELTEDPHCTLSGIQSFLHLPEKELRTKTVKQNPFPLEEILLNYREIREALRSTQYEWMLYGE